MKVCMVVRLSGVGDRSPLAEVIGGWCYAPCVHKIRTRHWAVEDGGGW